MEANIHQVKAFPGRNHVAHEASVTEDVLTDDHSRPGDGRVHGEPGLDLTQLNTETTQLHLVIRTTHIL
ncbi:hypothetical protein ABZ656_58110, partial [Streptomyces sp. NPDC007095]|uniref:hypothetical protein n=1 Tax=Streptomyces sp. NPDC007095 TaxID=3154482 RepID=UPI0033F0B603